MRRVSGFGVWFLLLAFACGACSAAEGPRVQSADPGVTERGGSFDARLRFLQGASETQSLEGEALAALLAELDAHVAGNADVDRWLAEAGTVIAPVALRAVLADGRTGTVVTRGFERADDTGARVESRLVYVIPPEGEAFAYTERFVAGSEEIEASEVADGALVPVVSTSMARAMTPAVASVDGPQAVDLEAMEGTSVEAINRVGCRACQAVYGALRRAGCGWAAGVVCGLAGISTAGPGLAICGALVAAVCHLGLDQVRVLEPSLVCNWIGARVSRDRQWCEETPVTCSYQHINAAANACDRCVRYARCAQQTGCRAGSGTLCTVLESRSGTAGTICRAAADRACEDRESDARLACRVQGYCE